jgi:hypothetical protein
MRLLDGDVEKRIDDSIVGALLSKEYDLAMDSIARVVGDVHANIPDNRRVSYGVVYAIRVLSEYLYGRLVQVDVPILPAASHMLRASADAKCRGISLGVLSFHGVDGFKPVLPLLCPIVADGLHG